VILIRLDGAPMGKERVRFARVTGRTYTPERTVNYESRLAAAAQTAMDGRDLFDGPLFVEVTAYMPVAESKPKKWKAAALSGEIRPTKKPDADNIFKLLDALNLVVWVDDSQIVEGRVRKFYSDRPRMEIRVIAAPTEGLFE
jgi:Holliday junction resolvase RusA-like endonuclease